MNNFYHFKSQFNVQYWNYVPAKWWHWRWCGGKFIMIRNITKLGTKTADGLHYLVCLDIVDEWDQGGRDFKWDIETHNDAGNIYEITTIWFRRADDAIMFKLEYA